MIASAKGCRVSRQLNNILLFSGVTFCYSMVLRRRNDHSSRLILIDRSEKIPTLILLSNGKIMGANSAGSCSFRYTVVLRRRNDHSSRLILIDRSEKIPTLILLSNGKIMGANSAGSCSFRYTVVYFFKGSIIQYSRTPELR